MPTIEEQKEKLRKSTNKLVYLSNHVNETGISLISHNAAIKQLLKDCKISAPANGDKTVVTKVVKSYKSLKITTVQDYQIKITDLSGRSLIREKLSEEDMIAKEAGLITVKLIPYTETKEVNIKDYSYITKIKTDIETLQGVK